MFAEVIGNGSVATWCFFHEMVLDGFFFFLCINWEDYYSAAVFEL